AGLRDRARVPFSRSYDKKHPPRLHVVFLDRESPDAVSQEDGDWVTERDPLATVSTGFRLTATLRANSRITNTVVVPPDYGCMPHTFVFSGEAGGPGEAGEPGPGARAAVAAGSASSCPWTTRFSPAWCPLAAPAGPAARGVRVAREAKAARAVRVQGMRITAAAPTRRTVPPGRRATWARRARRESADRGRWSSRLPRRKSSGFRCRPSSAR